MLLEKEWKKKDNLKSNNKRICNLKNLHFKLSQKKMSTMMNKAMIQESQSL